MQLSCSIKDLTKTFAKRFMMLKLAILHLYLTQKGQDLICGKSSADKDVGYKTIKVSSIF